MKARNPVAKYNRQINRPAIHRDRKKDVKRGRKAKHKAREILAGFYCPVYCNTTIAMQ